MKNKKKIIINTFLILGLLITIAGVVIWILSSDTLPLAKEVWAEIVGKIASFFPTLIGIIIKVYVSIWQRKISINKHLEHIDNHLKENGFHLSSPVINKYTKSKKAKKDIEQTTRETYGY